MTYNNKRTATITKVDLNRDTFQNQNLGGTLNIVRNHDLVLHQHNDQMSAGRTNSMSNNTIIIQQNT